jgi:hypothetical protein
MSSQRRAPRAIVASGLVLGLASYARAHGFVGDRFFPPTVLTDDPFAVDELTVPEFTYVTNPAGDGAASTHELDTGFEFDKEIFPHFAIGVSDDNIAQWARHPPTANGMDDIDIITKYELWQNEQHEAIIAIGFESLLGGTGAKAVDDPHTVFTPTFYWGKGFGDLPDSLSALKPFAITGTIGQELPLNATDPNTFDWGFALEYNLMYLQSQVMDVGLPAPFKDMIPLVEFSTTTNENRADRGQTTGFAAPGVLWESRFMQIGGEVLIPLNNHTGQHLGGVLNVDIFIDDIWPNVFGHPIFGEDK